LTSGRGVVVTVNRRFVREQVTTVHRSSDQEVKKAWMTAELTLCLWEEMGLVWPGHPGLFHFLV
jgi:hypothetical protein